MSSQSKLGEFDADGPEPAEASAPHHHDAAVDGDEAAQHAAGWVREPDDDPYAGLKSFNREEGEERTELGASVSELIADIQERPPR